jgi:MFS family permease
MKRFSNRRLLIWTVILFAVVSLVLGYFYGDFHKETYVKKPPVPQLIQQVIYVAENNLFLIAVFFLFSFAGIGVAFAVKQLFQIGYTLAQIQRAYNVSLFKISAIGIIHGLGEVVCLTFVIYISFRVLIFWIGMILTINDKNVIVFYKKIIYDVSAKIFPISIIVLIVSAFLEIYAS